MSDELLLLARANPAPAEAQPWRDQPLDARALDELAALEQGPAVTHPHRRWLLGAAAAGLVTLAVVTLNVLSPGATQVAVAATPPLPAYAPVANDSPAVLADIAAAAGRAETPAREQRRAAWQEWSLFTRVDGDQVRSAVVPQDVTISWAADGSGSVRAVTGEPFFPTRQHRAAWADAGEPGAPGTLMREEAYAAREFVPMYAPPPPSDPAEMEKYLSVGHPIDELGTAELFVAVEDLAREWTLNGPQRAAVLHVLASAPDVRVLGATEDRAGRPGTAFAVDSDHSGLPTRYVLVFDASTGALLASESQLTTDAGKLGVPVPSVISYSVWER